MPRKIGHAVHDILEALSDRIIWNVVVDELPA
jgi:hypothetical protein